MKRKKLCQRLRSAGYAFEDGGNHTKVKKDGKYVTTIPQHAEINERITVSILKKCGLQ